MLNIVNIRCSFSSDIIRLSSSDYVFWNVKPKYVFSNFTSLLILSCLKLLVILFINSFWCFCCLSLGIAPWKENKDRNFWETESIYKDSTEFLYHRIAADWVILTRNSGRICLKISLKCPLNVLSWHAFKKSNYFGYSFWNENYLTLF